MGLGRGAKAAGLGAALLASTAVVAQEQSGGVLLTFGLSQTLTATGNAGFAETSPGTTFRSSTDLSAAFSSETRDSDLELSVTTSLLGLSRPNRDDLEFEAGEPRFRLAYSHQATQGTRFSARLNYSERDITFIDPLTDFRDPITGEILFAEDFIALVDESGTGIRQNLGYSASLTFGDDRPFGLELFTSGTELEYRETTTVALVDSSRAEVGVTARFDLNAVTQATLTLSEERVESEGNTTEATTVDGNIAFTRPNGTLSFGASATETRAGTRTELSFARTLALPGDVNVSASLGLTSPAVGDDLFFTGQLTYARPLPAGSINARFDRSFGLNTDGLEEIRTSFSLGATHALTRAATLDLTAAFAASERTGLDDRDSVASIGAVVSYDLTRDWDLSAGYTFETRDSSDTSARDSSSLSLTVSREFAIRP